MGTYLLLSVEIAFAPEWQTRFVQPNHARELHDVLAHTLSGLAVELQGLRTKLRVDLDQAEVLLNNSLHAVREGLTETRRALQELRAKPPEDLGLALAVQTLAESCTARFDLKLDVSIANDVDDYSIEIH